MKVGTKVIVSKKVYKEHPKGSEGVIIDVFSIAGGFGALVTANGKEIYYPRSQINFLKEKTWN